MTDIHLACREGNLPQVKQLIHENSAVVNEICPRSNNTPLITACQHSKIEVALELIRSDKLEINLTNVQGFSALHFAILNNLSVIIDALLKDHRIEVNIKCKENFTPLQYAIMLKRCGAVEILSKNPNINLNVIDINDKTLACLALITQKKYSPLLFHFFDYMQLFEFSDSFLNLLPQDENIKLQTIKKLLPYKFILQNNAPSNEQIIKSWPAASKDFCNNIRENLEPIRNEVLENQIHLYVFCIFQFIKKGLFTIKPIENASNKENNAKRFFTYLQELPLEILMIISNRLVGSTENFLPGKKIAPILKITAKHLSLS